MTNPTLGLADKTLVMLVGPTAVGKSTVMHHAVAIDPRFSYVRSFTTRPDRGDGVSTYRHITEAEAERLQTSGGALTYFRHPTTGHVYGTTTESYQTEYNLLDTLSGSVALYRDLPFKRCVVMSITTNPDAWQTWVQSRYPEPSQERTKRLREAIKSIEWSLAQTDSHLWLINRADHPKDTADCLIRLATNDATSPDTPAEATGLKRRAERLLS